jgi:hypothetical protein
VQAYYPNGFAFICGLAIIDSGPGSLLAAALGYSAGMTFGEFIGEIQCHDFFEDPFTPIFNGPGRPNDYIFP